MRRWVGYSMLLAAGLVGLVLPFVIIFLLAGADEAARVLAEVVFKSVFVGIVGTLAVGGWLMSRGPKGGGRS